MSGAEAFYEAKLDRRDPQAQPETNLWTVSFAHKPLWDRFQAWLKGQGLCAWVIGREDDELSHGIGFASSLTSDEMQAEP